MAQKYTPTDIMTYRLNRYRGRFSENREGQYNCSWLIIHRTSELLSVVPDITELGPCKGSPCPCHKTLEIQTGWRRKKNECRPNMPQGFSISECTVDGRAVNQIIAMSEIIDVIERDQQICFGCQSKRRGIVLISLWAAFHLILGPAIYPITDTHVIN